MCLVKEWKCRQFYFPLYKIKTLTAYVLTDNHYYLFLMENRHIKMSIFFLFLLQRVVVCAIIVEWLFNYSNKRVIL